MTKTEAATLTITMPDVITVRIWSEYIAGRQEYLTANKDNPGGSRLLADYAGCLALIKAQRVKIEGAEPLKKYLTLDNHDNTPIAFVGLICREIAEKVDQAVDGPLVGF